MGPVMWPSPEPVTHFTPSSYELYCECPLRGYLSSDTSFKKYVYISPKARIGTACHTLLERMSSGFYDNLSPGELVPKLQVDFEKELQDQFNLSQSEYQESYSSPWDWPGVNVRFARLKLTMQKIHQERQRHRFGLKHVVEKHYVSQNGRLRIRVDRVLVSDHGYLLIEDYKTGTIYDDEGNLKGVIERQIFLYAYVCMIKYGVSSAIVRVVPLHGQPYESKIFIEQAKQEAAHASSLLDVVNEAIEDIRIGIKTYDDLAKPSIDVCKYCSFKFLCSRYLRSSVRNELESTGKFVTVSGIVSKVTIEANSTVVEVVGSTQDKAAFIIAQGQPTYISQLACKDAVTFTNLKNLSEDSGISVHGVTASTLVTHNQCIL